MDLMANVADRWDTWPRAWPSCCFIMSMWSLGVAIERFFTYQQARNQSKLFAPQVAKHLKEGRLKDAIALSSSKNYPVQPPREGRPRRAAGISVPAGKRQRSEP